jgi:mRNA interferase MazF
MVRQGDIVKLDFSPTLGHEQRGYRPGVVVSNDYVINKTNIVYIAPITNRNREFPLHVSLDERTRTTGVIICEQVKAVDLSVRQFVYVESLPDDILEEVLSCVIGCYEF